MTTKEAISKLQDMIEEYQSWCHAPDRVEALTMAIRALATTKRSVSANTPSGKKILDDSFRRDMKNMTKESAISMLVRTGMYDVKGNLKAEYVSLERSKK